MTVFSDWDILSDHEPLLIRQLPELFAIAYGKATRLSREKVAANYVELIAAAGGATVTTHETYLFIPDFLDHLNGQNREIVVDHLIDRLRATRLSSAQSKRLAGLSQYLDEDQRTILLDAYFRTIGYQEDEKVKVAVSNALLSEWASSQDDDFDDAVVERCKLWLRTAEARSQDAAKARFEEFLMDMGYDLA
jgi:hypothetical protein